MDGESNQVPTLPSARGKSGLYSLLLGTAGIVLSAFAQVLASVMYHEDIPLVFRRLMQTVQEPISFISIICGLLAILMGRIAYRRNRKSNEGRKEIAAPAGIVLGILALIPACVFVCSMLALGLANRQ